MLVDLIFHNELILNFIFVSGTGTLPVYPLLASRIFEDSFIYGTGVLQCNYFLTSSNKTLEIDVDSLALARKNIATNKLNDRIQLVHIDPQPPFIPPTIFEQTYVFNINILNKHIK